MKSLIYIKIIFFITILLVLNIACDLNQNIENNNSIDELHLKSSMIENSLLSDYAKILAFSLNNEIKTLIKKEAQKRFDGDYNILVSHFEELNINNITVKEILKTNRLNKVKEILELNTFDNQKYFEKIRELFPNLQISVPIYCEEWNPETFTPLVAFLPYDYIEKDRKPVRAYNEFGNLVFLDPINEPDFPVIVVSISERVDKEGKFYSDELAIIYEPQTLLKSAPAIPTGLTVSHGSSQQLILHWDDTSNETSYEIWRKAWDQNQFFPTFTTGQNINVLVNSYTTEGKKYWYMVKAINSDGSSGFSNIVATTSSGRYDGEYLKLKGMYMTSGMLNHVESWLAGAPEIRLRVVQGLSGGAYVVYTSGIIEPPKRKDIKDKWWYKQIPITFWYTSTIGTVLNFDFREEDQPNPKANFSITSSYEDKNNNGIIKSGGSLTFTNDPGDSHIGNTLVHFWDTRSHIYDLYGFKFQFEY